MIPEYSQELNDAYNRCVELCENGRLEDALPFAEKAHHLAEQELGPDQLATGVLLNLLADINRCIGRNKEVEPLFKRVISIIEKSHGPTYPYITIPMKLLEASYIAERRFVMSELVEMQAWAICEGVFGPDSQETLRTQNDLAVNFHLMAMPDEARFPHKRILPTSDKAPEPDRRDVGRNLYNLALLYSEQGHNAGAQLFCQRAKAIFEDIAKPDNPEITEILESCAKLLVKAGKADQRSFAVKLFKQARLFSKQDRQAEAVPLCRRAMAIFVPIAKPEERDSREVLGFCAKLLVKAGRGEEVGKLLSYAHPHVRGRVKMELSDSGTFLKTYFGFVAMIIIPVLLLYYCKGPAP